MMTVICILILLYLIKGKNADKLVEKIKSINWNEKIEDIRCRLHPYALKYGHIASRPLLQFYYVMQAPETTTLEKAMIYGAVIYTVSPVNLLPKSVYGLLGCMDEGAAITFVYKKIKNKITPEIQLKVERTLNEWFGDEYEIVKD